MKVKLRSVKEIEEAGFAIRQTMKPPGVVDPRPGEHVNLIRYDGITLTIDLKLADELIIAPQNSIPQANYEMFEGAFEVIEP